MSRRNDDGKPGIDATLVAGKKLKPALDDDADGLADADTAKETAVDASEPAVDATKPAATMLGTGPGEAAEAPTDPGPASSVDPIGGTVVTMPGHGGSGARKPKPTEPPAAGIEGDEGRWVGKVFCGYRIAKKLAEGGMGVVYLGEHEKIGRRGAIKVLKLEYCQDDSVVERFYQEARSVNEIGHEGIVDIFDFGRDDDGRVFFVMEFLEGEPLSDRVDRGALTFAETVHIFDHTCRALKAAHDKGFVHRDLKPENIWLRSTDTGKPKIKVLDFGIAKLVGMDNAQDKLTRTGAIIGTPHYMSPEQIDGSETIDHRSDIYSLGVILYELLTGKRPFTGDTLGAIITGHLLHEPPALSSTGVRDVPPLVEDIIDRMLAKKPDDRYESVTDVLADLKDVAANRQPTKVTVLNKQRPKTAPTIAKVPAVTAGSAGGARTIAIAAAFALALGAIGFVVFRGGDDVAKPPERATREIQKPPPTKPEPAAPDFEQLRTAAETRLSQALADAEPKIRVRSADAVGRLKHDASAPTLVGMLESDPDQEVRGHAAGALGMIGYVDAAPTMAKLSVSAPAALDVWLTEGRVRLGDDRARKRLVRYTRAKDLSVSFKAALALAEVSKPGDNTAIKALTKLAAREAELNDIAPFAGVLILTKTAALGDARSRDILYKTLDHTMDGARLAAAEGLARLGDESGATVLGAVFRDEGSSNRLVAARALVHLGDYSGFEFMTEKLGGSDVRTRIGAASGLGDIGEPKSLRKLEPMLADDDKTVRIAAATAILKIVGLAPAVLARASVDWASGALASEDWAMRDAAAGVIGDIPEEQALPLLAQAIADPEARVRLTAARSAGKLKTPQAATTIATAALAEADVRVKEEQVKSLGRIGSPVAKRALVELETAPGRVGVFAAGSLVAIGDTSAVPKLKTAFAAQPAAMRVAAAEASVIADNTAVVPGLKTGAGDKAFDVRFASAEGLAHYRSETAVAVPVLQEGLGAKDAAVRGRALAALARLGAAPSSGMSVEDMLRSQRPDLRLAAVPAIAEMKWRDARPLLRLAVADSDLRVRRAGIDAAARFAETDKQDVIKFYKPHVRNPDPVSRAKAKAQLSKLVEAPQATAPRKPAPREPTPAFNLAPVEDGLDATKTAMTAARAAKAKLDTYADDLDEFVGKPAKDDDDVSDVKRRGERAAELAAAVATARDNVSAAADAVADAAGATPPPEAGALVTEARALATEAAALANAAEARVAGAQTAVSKYVKAESADAEVYLQSADAAIAAGRLSAARRDLKKAKAAYKALGESEPNIDFSYGRLYEKRAQRATDDAKRLDYLTRAKASYDKFAAKGSGKRKALAKERSEELAEEIADLAK